MMNIFRQTSLNSAGLFLLIFFLYAAMHPPVVHSEEPVLPDNLTVLDAFRPGVGESVGRFVEVRGTVVVIHADETVGYQAAGERPIFQNDAIAVVGDGHARFVLNDGSELTLSSDTKLVISRSYYDPLENSRSAYIKMLLGKARFIIKKIVSLRKPNFMIKTRTAVMGVKGSEFIVTATRELTEIASLADTRLEIASLAAPQVPPIILEDFQKVVVTAGGLPSKIEALDRMETETMLRDFMDVSEIPGVEGLRDIRTDADRDGPVVIDNRQLVDPDSAPGAASGADALDVGGARGQSEEMQAQQNAATEEQHENYIKSSGEVPWFPDTPDD